MADFSPAQANYNPPSGLDTLSTLMGLKQRQQQMQKTALELPGVEAQSQQAVQGAQQNQAAGQFFKNFDVSKHTKEDGTLDLDSAMTSPELRATGSAAPDIIQKLIGIKNQQLTAKSSLAGLNGELRSQFLHTVGGLAGDPDVQAGNNVGKGKVQDGIQQFAQSGGSDAARVAQIYGQPLQNVPPNKMLDALRNIQLQAQSADRQAAATTMPSNENVNTGAQTVMGTRAPALAGGAFRPTGTIANQTPPENITAPSGQIVHVPGGGGTLPSIGANSNLTNPQKITQVGQATGVADRVEQAKVAANNTVGAQDALSRAKALLESPESPKTGGNFDSIRSLKNLMSSIGIDTQGADNMNTLTKNLARYEASRATQAGLGGTDAARELAHKGSPSTQLDNKALLGIVRQSLASEKAIASYAKVQSGTTDPQTLVKNENDFRNIPHLIEAHEFGMLRNPQEANEYLKSHNLSPQAMKDARDKIKEFDNR